MRNIHIGLKYCNHTYLNETEKEMINNIFEFDDKLACEVMTPRTEVYLINIDTRLHEYLDELLEERNIEYKNLIFKIEKIKEKRIKKIKVYVQREA